MKSLSPSRIACAICFLTILFTTTGRAQYSTDVFDLKAATDLYDERGYGQNGAISVDGKVVVSHSNGNLSYSYPISKTTISGYPLTVDLNYCGSVGFTAFKQYESGSMSAVYTRWDQFHASRPAWIVGVNGFAVQMLSSNTMFHCDPARFAGASRTSYNDSDLVWLADGYDFCNRMEFFGGITGGNGYVDHIRILRADGSVMELVNWKPTDLMQEPSGREDLYTGHYYVNEANARGFGVVSYDTTWAPHAEAIVNDAFPSGPTEAFRPRILRYYDGSGLEFVFREWPIAYGTNAYAARGVTPSDKFGNLKSGPTIFYLEQINSNAGGIIEFKRSRHYYPRDVVTLNGGNIFDPIFTSVLDSTVGRALTTDFGEVSISYGDIGMTVQAFGRTTKVRYPKVTASGNATSTTSLPMATRGYFTKSAAALADMQETGTSSGALYESYLAYVTEIIDPEGRITKFEYEPYIRNYVNYNFPITNPVGSSLTLSLKNYRLKKVTEPTAYYTIAYAPGNFFFGGIAQRIDTVRNATMTASAGSPVSDDNYAFYQNNVVSYVKKYDLANTLLTTQECEYFYKVADGFYRGKHRMYDNITGAVHTTEQEYEAEPLYEPRPMVPIPHFTKLITSTDSGEVVTATSTTYQRALGNDYLWLPTAQTSVVAGITKSKQTFGYAFDTARTYGGDDTLAAKFGLEVKRKVTNTLDPATNVPLLRDTTFYMHFPLIDTTLTRVDTILLKFPTMDNYFRLRDSLKVPWELAMFDPRCMVFRTDSSVGHNTLPPIYGLVKREVIANTGNYILGGKEYEYTAAATAPHYLNDLMFRGTLVRDWMLSAGEAVKYRNDSIIYTRGWGRNLVSLRSNANDAMQRFYYDSYSSLKLRQTGGAYKPLGKVKQNNDQTRDTLLPHGGYFSFAFEKPLINESYVRKYNPSKVSGIAPIDTMLQLNQYTFYGLLSGVVDYNGNYTQFHYDKNGRVTGMWAPYDFAPADTVDTVNYAGTQTIPLMGYSIHTCSIDTMNCQYGEILPGVGDTALHDNFYAGHNVADIPTCPCPPEEHRTEEKGNDRSIQEACTVHKPFLNNDYYHGFITYTEDWDSPLLYADEIDSIYLALHPTRVTGECVFMSVEIPQFSFTKDYVFNCSGGTVPFTTEFAGNDYLKVDLSAIKDDLLGLHPGSYGSGILKIYFRVSTAGGGVEFVNGIYAEDTRPQLVLKGTFKKPSDTIDYTLAYAYRDDSLRATVSAKVDDIKHTANRYDLAAMSGATVRRTSTTNYFGADGRVLKSAKPITEHGVTRIDSLRRTFSGQGVALKTTDEEGDTTLMRYDGMGRPVEMTNADGTHTTITYTIGTPSSFGIDSTDQDFKGFCSAKIMTNQNGVKTVEYYDAFDRLRRVVADSGNSSHLRLTTRYNYDADQRLAEIVTPKGDTIGYWYDIWGRVQQKRQSDLGIISYAYDKLGNIRFVQNQEQANKGRILFNEYDDLNRLVVVGEAVIGTNPSRPTFEDDGYEGEGGWLYGHYYLPGTIGANRKRERGRTVLSAPASRVTDNIDATILHIGGASSTTPVTTNPTLWKTPLSALPPMWSLGQTIYKYCTLPADTTFLNETGAPPTPLFRHPATFYLSPSGPGANSNLTDFEDLAKYPHFARMAIGYDTLPYVAGPVWGQFPSHTQWDSLAPHGKIRNTKGREAAVAYREHGGEPWHYVVMSYDERGRVEALLRWTENIGFDAVYYNYNAMNQVTTLRVVDFARQYQTWYGYDADGRVDSIWSRLDNINVGLVSGPFTTQPWRFRDTMTRPVDAEILYAYTRTGQVDTMRYPKINILVDYAYNHRKMLDSIVAWQITPGTVPDTNQLWKEVLGYNPIAQITSQWSEHDIGGSVPLQEYAYDAVNRLTGWYMWPDSTKYVYDKAGNRTAENWIGTGFPVSVRNTTSTYGGAAGGVNRLASSVTKDGSNVVVAPGTYNYAYDANGGQVLASHPPLSGVGGDAKEYVYSYRGLMRRIGTGDWEGLLHEARYRYSPNGEREQKRTYYRTQHDSVVNYPWTYYLLGGSGEQLAVYHGQQTSKPSGMCGDTGRRVYMYPAEYLSYGVGGTANLTSLPNGQKRYVIADHLGSARVVLDSGGMVIARYDYDPFGKILPVTGAVTGARKSYIDKERDEESELVNMGHRQLDGSRFTSVDPMWEKFPSESPYSYAFNNPVVLKDPNGDCPICPIIAFAVEHAAAITGSIVLTGALTKAPPLPAFLRGRDHFPALIQPGTVDRLEDGSVQVIGLHGQYFIITPEQEEQFGFGIVIPILAAMHDDGPEDAGPSEIPDNGPYDLSGPMDGTDARRKLKQYEIDALEAAGIEIHDEKGGKSTGKIDLFADDDGWVFIKPKSGAGPGEPVNINIDKLLGK